MTTLKLPDVNARLDFFISYVTDLNPLVVENIQFFVAAHAEGEAFATELVDAGQNVLALSARAVIEQEQAKSASRLQESAIANAREVVKDVREKVEYIRGELEGRGDVEALGQAQIIHTACGIGSRISLGTQSGLRRLLVVQQAGLKQPRAREIFTAFKQPDMAPRVDEALKRLDDSVAAQAKEKSEADVEMGLLEIAVEQSIKTLHRALRLVNAMGDDAPFALRTGLLGLQGHHWRIFDDSTSTPTSAKDAEPASTTDKREPVEPE